MDEVHDEGDGSAVVYDDEAASEEADGNDVSGVSSSTVGRSGRTGAAWRLMLSEATVDLMLLMAKVLYVSFESARGRVVVEVEMEAERFQD